MASRERHVGFYLVDQGLPALERDLGVRARPASRLRRLVLRSPAVFYIGSILLFTAAMEVFAGTYVKGQGAGWGLLAISLLLSLIPASELALSIVNFLVNFSFLPRLLPKLKWRDGIPEEFQTLVAIPAFFGDEEEIRELAPRLAIAVGLALRSFDEP